MSAPYAAGTPYFGQVVAEPSRRASVGILVRQTRPAVLWILALGLMLATGSIARAENEGQSELDQATEIKLGAKSFAELDEVVRLCRKALDKGLNTESGQFATELLAGTLTQRAEIICAEIFDSPMPPARWPEFRRMAMGDLEESLKLDSEQPDAQFLLGRLNALPGGDRPRSIAALDEVVRLSADQPARQAKALVLRGGMRTEPEARLEDYNRAVELAPHSAEIVKTRGLFYLSQSQYEEAIADLQRAVELAPKNPETYEAKGVAEFLLKRYDDALASLDAAVALAPESPPLYANRARIFAIKGQNDKALEELGKALQLEPRSVQLLLLRARVFQQAHKSDRAMEDVSEVLRMRPGFPEALQLHAYLAAGSGHFSEAIGDLEELKDLTPNNSELLLQLGMFYSADKRPQQAIEIFTQIITDDPANWIAHRARADSYLNLGKQAEALADYNAAVETQPENSGILNNLAWLLATSPDESLRDGKRAVELATTACKVTKYQEAHILSTLAAGYAELGDFTAAIRWSEEAVALGRASQKEQLAQELQSYNDKKPWREAMPPEFEFDPAEGVVEASSEEAVPEVATKPTATGDKIEPADSEVEDSPATENEPSKTEDDPVDFSFEAEPPTEAGAADKSAPAKPIKAPKADD
jgi:tetratricopeptide (TPR) repeat protein